VESKLGRLEIVYDEVDKVWRDFITVKVEKPHLREQQASLHKLGHGKPGDHVV
jgi:hypothetical protein